MCVCGYMCVFYYEKPKRNDISFFERSFLLTAASTAAVATTIFSRLSTREDHVSIWWRPSVAFLCSNHPPPPPPSIISYRAHHHLLFSHLVIRRQPGLDIEQDRVDVLNSTLTRGSVEETARTVISPCPKWPTNMIRRIERYDADGYIYIFLIYRDSVRRMPNNWHNSTPGA